MKKNKFYVTTPIYYVTAAPHLGSLYSTLLADMFARYHKLAGSDVFFLTGTDEHGQKVAQAASKAGQQPKPFVDSFIDVYKNMWKLYAIDYTKFIRTTDQYHVTGVQQWLQQLLDSGAIYKSLYTGFYCTPCETFVTEKEAQHNAAKELLCPSCMRAVVEVQEECYFFKLSAYQDRLLQFYEQNPDFITPKERSHEVISFVKEGLKDLSLSRKTVTWGIPFPGDVHHVTYVWADALNNYITAVGYGDATKSAEFKKWWPADMQILGKDIVRFHAVYWPAFLMASGLALPKKLLVHGWIKVDNQKMSKSLGNAVDPLHLAQTYGVDQIRYYLARKIAITQDSDFRFSDIEQSINSELCNDLGNLLNRVTVLAQKHDFVIIGAPAVWNAKSNALRMECQAMIQEAWTCVEQGFLYRALNRIWACIHKINVYFHEQEPWMQIRQDRQAFQETVAATIYALQSVGVMLWPIMPEKMERMLHSIGFVWNDTNNMIEQMQAAAWHDVCKIQKIDTLFQKHELAKEKLVVEEKPNVVSSNAVVDEQCLTFEDFLKVDMRVGQIKACEVVVGSDKLLKMQVDFGILGMRQIVSGIQKYYKPADLLEQQAIFVVNLKPRMLMGLMSQGMLLTATDASGLQRLVPAQSITPGSKIS